MCVCQSPCVSNCCKQNISKNNLLIFLAKINANYILPCKVCDPFLSRAIPEHFREKFMMKRYTNQHYFPLPLKSDSRWLNFRRLSFITSSVRSRHGFNLNCFPFLISIIVQSDRRSDQKHCGNWYSQIGVICPVYFYMLPVVSIIAHQNSSYQLKSR